MKKMLANLDLVKKMLAKLKVVKETEATLKSRPPSRACCPRKKNSRGPSQGLEALPEGQKWFIRTNKRGEPHKIDLATKGLVGSICLQVREILPVGYEEFGEVPDSRIGILLTNLPVSYNLRHLSHDWLQKKNRKAWRDRRFSLKKKYIKGKDNAEAMSERNVQNRTNLEFPNASGRHSLAQAKERNLLDDDEVGRAEVFIAMRSKKGKPDDEKMVFGKETRGRMRFMGDGVSLSSIKSQAHLVNKLVDKEKQNAENDSKLQKLSTNFEAFKDFVTKELSKPRMENNNCSQESPSSSASQSMTRRENATDIGKRCELYAWDRLVPRGEVAQVNPEILVYNVAIGEGNYSILVDTTVDTNAMLCRRNSQVETIFDVHGSFTVWAKQFLKF